MAAGRNFSLILKQDGSVWGTGHNEYGELGDGTTYAYRKGFVQAKGLSGNVVAITACGEHSLVLKDDGSAWSAGRNTKGQLGYKTQTRYSSTFMKVMQSNTEPVSDVTVVAAGYYFSVVLKADGTLWGAGGNENNQMSENKNEFGRNILTRITTDVHTVAAGGYSLFILKKDGSFWARGGNTYGQLGDGTRSNGGKITAGTAFIPIKSFTAPGTGARDVTTRRWPGHTSLAPWKN